MHTDTEELTLIVFAKDVGRKGRGHLSLPSRSVSESAGGRVVECQVDRMRGRGAKGGIKV